MTVKFTNNVKTKVAVLLTSDATVIGVEDVSRFPTLGPGEYTYCTLADTVQPDDVEICEVTSINASQNELTVVRGKEGTTPQNWRVGSACELRLTAELLTRAIEDRQPDWDEIENLPDEFPPSYHTHDQYLTDADSDGKQYARQDGAWSEVEPPSWDEILDTPTEFPPSIHGHSWGEITDKPTEFPPSDHGHSWGEITDTPTEFPPSAHGHNWGDIADKPTEFPPSDHTHPEFDELGDRIDAIEDSIVGDGGFVDAPVDGKTYGRKDGAWDHLNFGSPVVISDTAPENAVEGDLWFCSIVGSEGFFCFSDDPNGGEGYWFEVSTLGGGDGGTSVDLSNYVQKPSSTDSWMVYKDGWTPVTTDLVLTNSDFAFRDAKGRFKSTKEVPELNNQLEVNRWLYEQLEAAGGGTGAGAGMVISDTPPTDKVTGMQWLDSTTGGVFIWDEDKWIEFPAGKDGKDGADGQIGPQGPQGDPGEGGGSSLWEQNGSDIYYDAGDVDVTNKITADVVAIKCGAEMKQGGQPENADISGGTTDPLGARPSDGLLSLWGGTVWSDGAGIILRGKDTQNRPNSIKFSGEQGSTYAEFNSDGNLGIGAAPLRSTAKEQLAEWRSQFDARLKAEPKADKKAVTLEITDDAFDVLPAENKLAEWMETRGAGDKLQVDGTVSAKKFVSVNSNGYSSGFMSSVGNGNDDTLIPVNAAGSATDGTVSLGRTKVDNAGNPVRFKDGFFSGTVDADRFVADGTVIANIVNAQDLWAIKEDGGNVRVVNPGGPLGALYAWNIGFNGTADTLCFYDDNGDNKFTITRNGVASFSTVTVNGNRPVLTTCDLIETLSTLRNATQDETIDVRQALASACDKLIEKFESMQEVATQEISDE